MSAELKYKESITHSIWEEWKLSDARIVAGRVEIAPGGYMQFIKAPMLTEEKGIPQKYKVVITYNDSNLPQLYSKSKLMFEIHMTPTKANSEQEQAKFKTITTSAHPNTITSTGLDKCITYVDAKGGTADLFKIILRNNLNQDVTVVSVDVHPSYAVDDTTLSEIEQHIPSVLHGTNSDRIYIRTGEPSELISMDVGTVMNTNLQVHFMVNGVLSNDAEVTLDFKVDDEHLPYSPLEFKLPAGPFLLGIPANIMQVDSGNNAFKVLMTTSSGTVDIKPFKVQCTIDGKGMLSKSSSAAPSVNELLRVPFIDVTENTNETEMSFLQTQCIPIPCNETLIITALDITKDKTVTELIGIEQSRVAEDVWFGPTWENGNNPCLHEVFTYNTNVIIKQSGKLQFKPGYTQTMPITNSASWLNGDLYSIDLDVSDVAKYERVTLATKKHPIHHSNIVINPDNFNKTSGYTISDGIEIITSFDKESNTEVVTDNENYTYATIEINSNEFNDIKELQ